MKQSSEDQHIYRIVSNYIEPLSNQVAEQAKQIENLSKLMKEPLPLPDDKNPEWVICVLDYQDIFTKNKLYKCTGIEHYSNHSQYLVSLDDKGSETNGHTKGMYLREATKGEIEAHNLGFHIGDPITFGHASSKYSVHFIGNIIGFNCDENVLLVETDKDISAVLGDNIQIDDPKIITEEGDKIYEDGKCWYVPFLTHKFDLLNYDEWEGNKDPNGKYFTEKGNAEKYFNEIDPQKINIRIDILNKHLLFNPTTLLAEKKKYKKLYNAALKAMIEYATYMKDN